VLEVGSGPKFQLLPHFHILGPSSGSNKELGSASGGGRHLNSSKIFSYRKRGWKQIWVKGDVQTTNATTMPMNDDDN
jgi:hypothetical protein